MIVNLKLFIQNEVGIVTIILYSIQILLYPFFGNYVLLLNILLFFYARSSIVYLCFTVLILIVLVSYSLNKIDEFTKYVPDKIIIGKVVRIYNCYEYNCDVKININNSEYFIILKNVSSINFNKEDLLKIYLADFTNNYANYSNNIVAETENFKIIDHENVATMSQNNYDNLNIDESIFASSIIFGDSSRLDKINLDLVKELGLIQIFVVSGFNFVVLRKFISFINRYIYLDLFNILVIVLFTMYYLNVLFNFASLRSFFTIVLATIAIYLPSKLNFLRLTALILLISILYNPFCFYNLSFLLSMFLFIGLYVGKFVNLDNEFIPTKLTKIFTESLVAFISVFPIITIYLGKLNLNTLITSILISPFVSFYTIIYFVYLLSKLFYLDNYIKYLLYFLHYVINFILVKFSELSLIQEIKINDNNYLPVLFCYAFLVILIIFNIMKRQVYNNEL